MDSGADPVDYLFRVMRDAVSPLECGISRAAKDLESHWMDSRKMVNESGFTGRFNGQAKKRACQETAVVSPAVSDDRKKGLFLGKIPMKSIIGALFPNPPAKNRGARVKVQNDGSCLNCLNFAGAWSILVSNFVQVFPNSLKCVKKCFRKSCNQADGELFSNPFCLEVKRKELCLPQDCDLPSGLLICYAFENLIQNLEEIFDRDKSRNPVAIPAIAMIDHMKTISDIVKRRRASVNGFLSNVGFAKLGGASESSVGTAGSADDEGKDPAADYGKEDAVCKDESGLNPAQKLASKLLNIPLSNVERLRSILSTVSLTELIEFVSHLGKSSQEHPSKKKLFSVQDFFRYTEAEGKRLFEELDRDGDGQVTLEDLEIAMRRRKLPRRYARDFLRHTRSNLFSKSIGWKQFLSFMEQKEPTILRAYTTLCLSKSGTLQKNQILTSLKSAGLPDDEANAIAMMRYLNADTGESISYSHFRNFMLLLPSERLEEDPRSIWFEAATLVAVPPPVEIPAESVLKSALAGGLASALSTSVMYPIDTMKTRVQASTLSFPELVSRLPEIGIQGLYRGSIPAILGQFSSHGLRTGIFEASKLILINVAPTLPDIQVQSIASFCSTVLGTAVRIPCEVLKQRLQAGIFDNVGEAIVGTLHQDGLKGFFRGTGATLCREVPFYVAGMGIYAEAKKAAQSLLNRELEPWETIAVGALSGGLSAVITNPFDVMKTRMMTAPQGQPVSMQIVAFSVLQQEGPLGFFKGALPRFFWIAPLGAMNFAGYELAKKAMIKSGEADTRLPRV
ncbi:mitochondrial substrate carrier family protein C [Phalaenopsis equestris]|uniref:mitochondrial substrate carrier family protein C n=1 Tax=Phalaenopsis equestris TaxID=78828 RepID=UPI0009E3D2DA|nr:mitochondrial substrate carrier family protein C [Phalaenopsis equestris]